jgi:hypothetical protein
MWFWTGLTDRLPGDDREGVRAPRARGTAARARPASRGREEHTSWQEAAALRLKLREGRRVRGPEQLRRLVDEFGFCHAFTPEPPEHPFPVAAVPAVFEFLPTEDEDTRWDWAWTWKDSFLESGGMFYARLVHRKPTYVSSQMLPCFYAMTGNVGEEDDCPNAREEGRVSAFACTVYDRVAASGPTSTIELGRHFAVSRATLDRALAELQTAMLLVPAGTRPEGPRKYTYLWDTFPRRFPGAVAAASSLSRSRATEEVVLRYLQLAWAASEQQICRALPVPPFLITNALQRLQSRGLVAYRPPAHRAAHHP